MRTIPVVFAVLLALGCGGGMPSPAPPPAPGGSYCAAMCDHIGPKGLNCPEGQSVYDSSLPGPTGVPNESCTDFCTKQEQNGVFINPKCVAQATSCADIEPSRQRTCN